MDCYLTFNYSYLTDDLEAQHKQLKEKLDKLQSLASSLQMQLAVAQSDAAALQSEKEQCQKEHAEQCQKLQAAIDAAIVEKNQLEVKWQKDFEQLRTHHSGKSEKRLKIFLRHLQSICI